MAVLALAIRNVAVLVVGRVIFLVIVEVRTTGRIYGKRTMNFVLHR
jgi:hypothetical protein